MSYILDALRKSEQQRLQGEAPLLVSTQLSSNVEKQPTYLLYGLVASTLICAGILIGWWRPWQQHKTEPTKDSIALAQEEAKLPKITPISQQPPHELEQMVQKSIPTTKLAFEAVDNGQDLPKPKPKLKPAEQQHKSQSSNTLSKGPKQIVDESATPTMEKTIPPSPEPNDTIDETVQEQKIIAMTELPLAIQQELPKMTISGHAYSTVPKERIVGINDRLLQEWEYLSLGLRLEQITTDGLVFSYKKYLFRRSL